MIKLISTDSYYNLFPLLNTLLKGKVNTLGGKNLIFCEEKISLMAERSIMSEYGGSFNTAVYSFGNFLRARLPRLNALTKEGSAMAVKRVLSNVKLNCFRASRATLAPSLFELIIQLKSAKVKPGDLLLASEQATGTLKNKLIDVASVYQEYQSFIESNKLDDQSSVLNYLPEIILNDCFIKDADVYLVGFNGFTSQIRSAISALLKRAKSVTAVFTEGENDFLYVNETADCFRKLVKEAGLSLIEEKIASQWSKEGEVIAKSLFNPLANVARLDTDRIFYLSAENKMIECERVAEIIRQKVSRGECRYRDITVAIPDAVCYSEELERAFNMLEVPYFLDQKKGAISHPLIRLILAYVDCFRKNLEQKALSAFYKNPLFNGDKELSDEFENYTLAYNVNFNRIKKPLAFDGEGKYHLTKLEAFRQKIVACFSEFNPKKLLKDLEIERAVSEYSDLLSKMGEREEMALNDQVYSAVVNLLTEIEVVLNGVELSLTEYKNVFLSGVSAMELSIIPQYNDAVFVGGLKETALAKAKCLFVLGLTSDLPAVKEDVALLSDGDIDALENVKVLVEPKIRVVNHRARENAGLALSAFSDRLYLSYPMLDISGDKTVKSQMLTQIEELFTLKPFPKYSGFLSYKQGLSTFARATGDFATGKILDFTKASSFYQAVDDKRLDKLLDRANKQVKIRLENSREIMSKKYISPTRIENYYACPYQAFLSGGLKLKPREEGGVDHLSVGNIMHEIFGEYALKMDEVKDKASSDRLVEDIAKKLFEKQQYARFLTDPVTLSSALNAVSECAKFCYKNYLAIKNSSFKVAKTEVGFGDGRDCEYPAIELDGGRVKLQGKIDRVDECENYFRILDYKSGEATAELDQLFTGRKLQLYLYAKAVSQKLKDSRLAGVYYMPVWDGFRKEGENPPVLSRGLTLSDVDVIRKQDGSALDGESVFLATKEGANGVSVEGETTEQGLNAMMEYAVKISDLAVKRMGEGIIAPSPSDDKCCGYCEYKSLCQLSEATARKHGRVDATTIIDAINDTVRGEE